MVKRWTVQTLSNLLTPGVPGITEKVPSLTMKDGETLDNPNAFEFTHTWRANCRVVFVE